MKQILDRLRYKQHIPNSYWILVYRTYLVATDWQQQIPGKDTGGTERSPI